jgi:hypothetical protein
VEVLGDEGEVLPDAELSGEVNAAVAVRDRDVAESRGRMQVRRVE